MREEIQEFMNYLHQQVDTHAIYVLGGQGEYIVDILPNLTSMEETKRVDQILTLISQNLKQYYGTDKFDMMTSRAFDCSGLGTYFFLLKKLIKSDTTANGLYKQCVPISAQELVEGDMVFQRSTQDNGETSMHHVGYYIGDGKVIESKGRAYGVVITDFSTSRWSDYGRAKWWYEEGSISRLLRYVKGNLMRGEDVELVQSKLALLGYPCGTVDGVFGKKTDDAVRLFQADSNLTVDGIVGKDTCTALGLKWNG